MKRIAILTAGGDTPALNATIHGAVVRANKLRIEIYGLIKGFNSLFNPRVPHLHLNPLFQEIPELDPTKGGTLIGSSRDYIDPDQGPELDQITDRLMRLASISTIAARSFRRSLNSRGSSSSSPRCFCFSLYARRKN